MEDKQKRNELIKELSKHGVACIKGVNFTTAPLRELEKIVKWLEGREEKTVSFEEK
jgi:hypothetical protein